jgi:hypothetical protein
MVSRAKKDAGSGIRFLSVFVSPGLIRGEHLALERQLLAHPIVRRPALGRAAGHRSPDVEHASRVVAERQRCGGEFVAREFAKRTP